MVCRLCDHSFLSLLVVGGFLLELPAHQSFFSDVGVALALLQRSDVLFDVLLQLVGTLVVGCLRLVVDPAVLEDTRDVVAEVLTVAVFVVCQLLLDGLDVDRLLNDQVIVRHVIDGHWVAEWPRSLVLLHQIEDILALKQE
jgi:hypothetical protein